MANLKTTLCGVEMDNPFVLGSGPLSYGAEGIIKAAQAGAGAVVTKTIRREAAINPTPHMALCDGNSILNTEKWSDYAIGSSSNQNELADTVICSRMEVMSLAIYSAIKQYVDGDFAAGSARMGVKEGVCFNDWSNSKVVIPDDIMKQVEEVGEKMVNGEIAPEDIPQTEAELEAYKAAL